MFASKTILPIAVLTLLLWSGVGKADILQLKCIGTNADVRYVKVEIDGRTYYADKFGRIAVPNMAALANKPVTVYVSGNRGTVVQVPRGGVLFVPCR